MSASPRMSLSPNVGTAPLPVTPGQPNDAPGSEEPSYPSPPRWANNASSQPVASSPRPNQASYNSPQRSPQHAQQSLSPEPAQSAQPDEEEEEDLDDLFGDEPAEGGAMSGVEDRAGAKRASSTDSEAEGSTKGSPRRRRSSGSRSDRSNSEEDDGLSEGERARRRELEYGEEMNEDEEEEQRERHVAAVSAPQWDTFAKPGDKVWALRLPGYVHHDPSPFHPDTYTEPPENPDVVDPDDEAKLGPDEVERRKAEALLSQVEQTIRWRWVKGEDGQMTRQSNARLVRWTDGSLSLQLGAPSNLFNLTHYPSNAAHPKAFMANTLYGAQLMQSEAALAGHISLVPANLQGEMHRKLAKSVKGRNVATGRLKTWDDENMVALNVENGKKDKKGKGAKKTGAGGGGAGGGARKKVTGPSAKRQSRRGSIYSEDSDSEVDVPAKRRGAGASQGKKGKRDDEEGGQYKEDGFVVDDSDSDRAPSEDSDEAAYGSKSKSKSKGKGKASKAKPKSSSKSKSKSTSKKSFSSDDEDEEPEAVESEEEEEEAASSEDDRRKKKGKGGGSGRKREQSVESEEMESEEEEEDEPEERTVKKRKVVLADGEDEDEDY